MYVYILIIHIVRSYRITYMYVIKTATCIYVRTSSCTVCVPCLFTSVSGLLALLAHYIIIVYALEGKFTHLYIHCITAFVVHVSHVCKWVVHSNRIHHT